MKTHPHRRRGVLLLVVLSLLVLFVLAGTTFVATSGQFRKATSTVSQVERSGRQPTQDLDAALMQLLREPASTSSSALYQSLLRDLYGSDHSPVAQITYVGVLPTTPSDQKPPGDVLVLKTARDDFDPTYDDYYTGCVLTMTSGELRNRSTRILRYFPNGYPEDTGHDPNEVVFVVERFADTSAEPSEYDRFLVNGRPLNGVGSGYNTSNGQLDTSVLFNPHHRFTSPVQADRLRIGGMDEGYDAPDLNNVFLAWQPSTVNDSADVIPTFHRPAAANYRAHQGNEDFWLDSPSSNLSMYTQGDRDQWRAALLRPTKIDHPNFTGSNDLGETHPLGFNPVTGPWDVDNDGDGISDSVWVDLGMPAAEMANGKKYKPLFAILCLDLDGRVNINAAGSLETLTTGHFIRFFGQDISQANPVSFETDLDVNRLFNLVSADGYLGQKDLAGSITTIVSATDGAPRGHGVGPAEISLYPLLTTTAEVGDLIRNRYLSVESSDFDTLGLPGFDPYSQSPDLPSVVDDDINFRKKNIDIPLAWQVLNPDDSDGIPGFPAASPIDAHGLGLVALTEEGHPLMALMDQDYDLAELEFEASDGFKSFREGADDPYEIDLFSPKATDNPYSASNLEPLLRLADYDLKSTSPRLTDIISNPEQVRSLITTDSFEVPVPKFQVPESRRPGVTLPKTVFDFYAEMQGGTPTPQDIPVEFRRGERFNVNREIDDNETFPFLTRQEYARHLYTLAMFLRDYTTAPPNNSGQYKRIARQTAQWAINAVDFRDADSVMTPFVYDEYPFDGWTADPNNLTPAGDRQVVWGCERPDLIITETLAWHDRRTEDLTFPYTDGMGDPQTNPDLAGGDGTFDQKFLPKGCLFIELYNPWNTPGKSPGSPGPRPSAELYGPGGGIELDEDTWRIKLSTLPDSAMADDRFVYFYTPAVAPPNQPGEYRPSSLANPKEVMPGEFAVVGTYELKLANLVTPLGFTNATSFPNDDSPPMVPTDLGQTRSVVMSSTANTISVRGNGSSSQIDDPLLDVPAPPSGPCTIIPIRNLSISEPRVTATGQTYDLSVLGGSQLVGRPGGDSILYFSPPLDQPLDANRSDLLTPDLLTTTQTVPSYRIAYLQRLADPRRPFDATDNPYITVDSSTIDLTVFNGVTTDGDPADNNDRSTRDNAAMNGTPLANRIWNYSRQRGDGFFVRKQVGGVSSSQFPYRTLWSHQPDTVPIADPDHPENDNSTFPLSSLRETNPAIDNPPMNTHKFEFALRSSLGRLGHRYEPPNVQNPPEWDPNNSGREEPCFPWLTWNNRPYHSAHELMLVPGASAEELLTWFGYVTRDFERENGVGVFSFYQPAATYSLYKAPLASDIGGPGFGTGGTSPNPVQFRPFGHFYNLFASTDQLNRVLDFIETPPRFLGTEKWFTDPLFRTANAMSLYQNPIDATSRINHRASRFRNPGLVNINTISDVYELGRYDAKVWNAIAAGASRGPSWDEIRSTMRVTTLDPALPTQFNNPFRPAAGADLLADALNQSDWSSQASFLRQGSSSNEPLFSMDLEQAYQESYRNPYFYLRPVTRLSNLVTTQSNVFAVWITVGYFEVQPWTTDPNDANHNVFSAVAAYKSESDGGTQDQDVAHPDGLMLGPELGSDTGEINRHRAFYIIDRSIPVGFEPGKDHNAADTILLRRFIE